MKKFWTIITILGTIYIIFDMISHPWTKDYLIGCLSGFAVGLIVGGILQVRHFEKHGDKDED